MFQQMLEDLLKAQARFATNPHTAKDLIDTPHIKEDIGVSFGYRPSGMIHLGNINTFLTAAQLGLEFGTYRTTLKATEQDLDQVLDRKQLPDLGLSLKKRRKYCPFFKYAIPREGCPSPDENSKMIEDFLGELANYTGLNIETHKMSDISRTDEFRQKLKRVCDEHPKILKFFNEEKAEIIHKTKGGCLLFPVDPETKVTNIYGAKYDDGKVIMDMPYLDREVSFDIMDPNYEMGLHFLLSPIRDVTNSYGADVHVHGGDRVEDTEGDDFTKIEKTAAVLALASSKRPLPVLTVGPMVYGADGLKMSKSKRNGLTLEQLRGIHGKDTMSKLMDYTKHIIDEGIRNVDFNVTQEYLLK